MARQPGVLAILVAACALTLGACSRQADTNPVAPVPGATGSATVNTGAPSTQPGTGLGGGLNPGVAGSTPATGTGTGAPMGAGPALSGSPNTTSRNAVGQR